MSLEKKYFPESNALALIFNSVNQDTVAEAISEIKTYNASNIFSIGIGEVYADPPIMIEQLTDFCEAILNSNIHKLEILTKTFEIDGKFSTWQTVFDFLEYFNPAFKTLEAKDYAQKLLERCKDNKISLLSKSTQKIDLNGLAINKDDLTKIFELIDLDRIEELNLSMHRLYIDGLASLFAHKMENLRILNIPRNCQVNDLYKIMAEKITENFPNLRILNLGKLVHAPKKTEPCLNFLEAVKRSRLEEIYIDDRTWGLFNEALVINKILNEPTIISLNIPNLLIDLGKATEELEKQNLSKTIETQLAKLAEFIETQNSEIKKDFFLSNCNQYIQWLCTYANPQKILTFCQTLNHYCSRLKISLHHVQLFMTKELLIRQTHIDNERRLLGLAYLAAIMTTVEKQNKNGKRKLNAAKLVNLDNYYYESLKVIFYTNLFYLMEGNVPVREEGYSFKTVSSHENFGITMARIKEKKQEITIIPTSVVPTTEHDFIALLDDPDQQFITPPAEKRQLPIEAEGSPPTKRPLLGRDSPLSRTDSSSADFRRELSEEEFIYSCFQHE